MCAEDRFCERNHVYDETSAHLAVAAAKRAAESLRFPPERVMAVAVCTSEFATNILKYARRGVITVSTELPSKEKGAGAPGIRILAEDRGPGIPDIRNAMRDNFSTSGTLGLGLPGVKRMGDDFSIVSRPGEGVRVSVLILARAKEKSPGGDTPAPVAVAPGESFRRRLATAASARAVSGEKECGDTPAIHAAGDVVWLALFDGMGHGRHAADASRLLAGAIPVEARAERTVTAVLEALHEQAKKTVGAAGGILRVDTLHGRASYAGVGNIAMRLFGERRAAPAPSTDGMLGRIWHTPKETHFQLDPGDLLVLASDGVALHPTQSDMAPLRHSSPESVAHFLLRRFGGQHDDVSCVTARWTP